jgi:glutamine synthetase
MEVTEQAGNVRKGRERAEYFKNEVVPAMDALRVPIDKLEMIVKKELWPMPSYGDLLFEV